MLPTTGVLIIDRYQLSGDGLMRSLSQFSYIQVLGSVTTGAEALTYIVRKPPDVMVLRLQQPTITEIRRGEGWEELDILPHVRQKSETTRMLILAHDVPDAKKYDVVRYAKNYAHAGIQLPQLADAIERIGRGILHMDRQLIPEDSNYLDQHEKIGRLGKGVQWENLRLIQKGLDNDRIAQERFVSINTVKSEVKQLYSISQTRNRIELALWVDETGALTCDPGRQSMKTVIKASAS